VPASRGLFLTPDSLVLLVGSLVESSLDKFRAARSDWLPHDYYSSCGSGRDCRGHTVIVSTSSYDYRNIPGLRSGVMVSLIRMSPDSQCFPAIVTVCVSGADILFATGAR